MCKVILMYESCIECKIAGECECEYSIFAFDSKCKSISITQFQSHIQSLDLISFYHVRVVVLWFRIPRLSKAYPGGGFYGRKFINRQRDMALHRTRICTSSQEVLGTGRLDCLNCDFVPVSEYTPWMRTISQEVLGTGRLGCINWTLFRRPWVTPTFRN